MSLKYTTIQHYFRKANGLTNNEYVFCDMISMLCKQIDSRVPGWCYMSKENQGKELDVSKQSAIVLANKMVDRGFLERQPVTGYLRTTAKWEKVYFFDGQQSLPAVNKVDETGQQSLPNDGQQSLPYNNNLLIKDIYNKQMSKIKISDDAKLYIPNENKLELHRLYDIDKQELEYFKTAEKFRLLFIKNLKDKGAPTFNQEKATYKNYVTPIRLMLQKNECTIEQLRDAYKFLNSAEGEFWKTNVLSTDTLRRQMAKLLLQKNRIPDNSNKKPTGFIPDHEARTKL